MIQKNIIFITALSFSSGAVQAQESRPDTLFKLFKALEGHWQCDGAFANGKPLASDITMSLTNGGRVLHYRHVDQAPNNYAVSGHWSYFEKLDEMIVTYHSSADTLSTYRSNSWTDNAVSFEAVEYLAPPLWRENKFSFSLKDDGTLYFVWEVMSEDGWKMGDYLNCFSTNE